MNTLPGNVSSIRWARKKCGKEAYRKGCDDAFALFRSRHSRIIRGKYLQLQIKRFIICVIFTRFVQTTRHSSSSASILTDENANFSRDYIPRINFNFNNTQRSVQDTSHVIGIVYFRVDFHSQPIFTNQIAARAL